MKKDNSLKPLKEDVTKKTLKACLRFLRALLIIGMIGLTIYMLARTENAAIILSFIVMSCFICTYI